MRLYGIPMICVLIGLALYVILGGAGTHRSAARSL
jgi:hypothetical protein